MNQTPFSLARLGERLHLLVELDCLDFRPFVLAMPTTAVVRDLDNFLRSVHRGGANSCLMESFFVEIFGSVFPSLHWFSP